MNEQMIEDELQHKLAEAIDNVIWPLADWDGDRLNASSAAGKAARAAHSVIAGKVAELTDVAEEAWKALEAMMRAWFDYHDAHSLTQPVTGAAGNAFDLALAARERIDAALAPYPERRHE